MTPPPRTCIVTVLAPVPEPELPRLGERLSSLDETAFAAVEGTHFARFAVLPADGFATTPHPRGMRTTGRLIDALAHLGRPQKPDHPALSYLLFTAAYDGFTGDVLHADYSERLRTGLGATADEIFGLCTDYPGRHQALPFATFLADRSLPAGYVFPATDEQPTVATIVRALQVRRQVVSLATSAGDLGEADLAKRIRTLLTTIVDDVPPLPASSPPRATVVPAALPAVLAGLPRTGHRPPTEPDLSDVQSLVTSANPRHLVSRHLTLRIDDPGPARRWLGRAVTAVPSAAWAAPYADRLGPAGRVAPGSRVASSEMISVHVAFSYSGLARLGVRDDDLAGFPEEFRLGMAAREAGLSPGRGARTYERPYGTETIDALVMLSAASPEALAEGLIERPWLSPGGPEGFAVLDTVEGSRIPGPGNDVRREFVEHFGFIDGISQPRIHGVTTGPSSGPRRKAELPAGEVLLGFEDVDGDQAGAGLPTELSRHGSYLVYRKVRQDVPAFRALTTDLASRLGSSEELAAAKLMGRHRDGRPLTHKPPERDGIDGVSDSAPNDFGFQADDPEGFGCPVGAHIRRVNPRDSRPVDVNPGEPRKAKDLEIRLAQRHRMLRRGIPYGPPLEAGETGETDGQDRGLLFIALVGDIRRQFEFVQGLWMSDGNAFRLGDERDLLCGAATADTKFTVQGHPPAFVLPDPDRPPVTCTGGEYFLLPSLSALRRLASL